MAPKLNLIRFRNLDNLDGNRICSYHLFNPFHLISHINNYRVVGLEAFLYISRLDPLQGLQRNATRRILHVGVEKVAAATNTLPELLCVSILGESFLYRMVRYIVSSILLVKIFG